ncbi:hypothetical protein [Sulfurimonas sp.]|jgi:hypothetical protein|uniref:hypothetical protein n=1 Tax=Sulfurimonas sp. TaxID=2022749 RepID=UPI002A3640E7|nr:hypothetical protein [Sulfurimonas sp.]MDY0122849.1 hypothetical protein [Sulfurimonas sp.]
MTFKETMAAVFASSEGAYYKWKKENRPIITLLDKYFSREDLEEFLETGKVAKLENLNLIDKSAKKIVAEFFYQSSTNSHKNKEFADVIFPAFVKKENDFVKNQKKLYEEKIAQIKKNSDKKEELKKYVDSLCVNYKKRELIKFIIETDLDIDKTTALLEISPLNDLEIHFLINFYRNFLDTIDNISDFIKINHALSEMKNIEKEMFDTILQIKNGDKK